MIEKNVEKMRNQTITFFKKKLEIFPECFPIQKETFLLSRKRQCFIQYDILLHKKHGFLLFKNPFVDKSVKNLGYANYFSKFLKLFYKFFTKLVRKLFSFLSKVIGIFPFLVKILFQKWKVSF